MGILKWIREAAQRNKETRELRLRVEMLETANECLRIANKELDDSLDELTLAVCDARVLRMISETAFVFIVGNGPLRLNVEAHFL